MSGVCCIIVCLVVFGISLLLVLSVVFCGWLVGLLLVLLLIYCVLLFLYEQRV